MPIIPDRFQAYVVDRRDDRFERGLRELSAADLPEGDVEIRVEWSSVNFKDGLAATEDGKVARAYPLVPGIDLAGTVVRSGDPAISAGDRVLAHGYDLGVSHHGGFSELARVPAGWVVPLPPGLAAREAMAIGTAGFTAAMGVAALQERGLDPDEGPVLVTGATGGVGSIAISILGELGFEVWAVTGKPDEHAWLAALGAVGFLSREEASAEGRPLEKERWAGAVDAVGAATLPYVLRTLRRGAAVASCGNASGAELRTTVFPFILRGVALLGMDSAYMPIGRRRALWARLATDLRPRSLTERVTEVGLHGLEPALDAIRRGEARGRWIVNVAGDTGAG
jgi:putative YhdH/YhfP family quinone oxidoreductase